MRAHKNAEHLTRYILMNCYASAMNGQDFAAFKYGWWGLSRNFAKLHERPKREQE